MPYYAEHKRIRTSRDKTDAFYGYDARLKIPEGYWNYTENLSTEYYPLLAPRKLRTCSALPNHPLGLLGGDEIAYVDTDKEGTTAALFYGFGNSVTQGNALGVLDPTTDKQLVRMGAWICIFPDKKAYNTVTGEWKLFEAHYEGVYQNRQFQMCHADGVPYSSITKGKDEPENKSTVWIETDEDGNRKAILEYSESSGSWVELSTVYTRINYQSLGEIPSMFKADDVVDILEEYSFDQGKVYPKFEGKRIIALGGGGVDERGERIRDYIVIINTEIPDNYPTVTKAIIQRTAPDLDFVCEAQNRLWGCKHGIVGGKYVNEIYACALGDFTNWNKFNGISTDSYAASVGTPGEWTGCINYLGYPTFFKEDYVHTVSISASGAHRISDVPCRGVEKGSHRSLVMVNETLYYKSKFDFCRYNGNVPQGISEELGDAEYRNCVAGTVNGRYYVQAEGREKATGVTGVHMFIYDTRNGLWIHEDQSPWAAYGFAAVGKSLFCAIRYGTTEAPKIYDLTGNVGRESISPIYHEHNIKWTAQSGALYTEYPDNKYAIRFDFRVEGKTIGYLDPETHERVNITPKLRVFVKYSDDPNYTDNNSGWVDKGEYNAEGLRTIVAPVTPHRCDTMKIKLVGEGDVKVLSMAKILEVGTDV